MLRFLFVFFLFIFPVAMILYSKFKKNTLKKEFNKAKKISVGFTAQDEKAWKYSNKLAYGIFKVSGYFTFLVSLVVSVLTIILCNDIDILINIFSAVIIAEAVIFISSLVITSFLLHRRFNNNLKR